MDFLFYNPVRIIGGAGCVAANAAIFREMGERALIVTGAESAKISGALGDVTGAMGRAGVQYLIFDGMRENPLLSLCVAAGDAAREFGADYIVAIGGGSALDGARAASVFAVTEYADPAEIFERSFQQSLPLITIGTTAGTGSEVDDIAVITQDKTNQKRGIKSPLLFAKIAFYDHNYTKSMNLRQTVSTALDALCHCFESWFNTAVTETSATMARRGAKLIYPHLVQIAEGKFDPNDDKLRRDLYHGSLWGGLAIAQSGTGWPHPAGYSFTETMGLAHGVACALFEPAFLQDVYPKLEDQTRNQFLSIAGTLENCIATIETLSRNDIRSSQSFCEQVGNRAEVSANIKKTPGGYTGQQCVGVAQELFLDKEQIDPVRGAWRFGEEEQKKCAERR